MMSRLFDRRHRLISSLFGSPRLSTALGSCLRTPKYSENPSLSARNHASADRTTNWKHIPSCQGPPRSRVRSPGMQVSESSWSRSRSTNQGCRAALVFQSGSFLSIWCLPLTTLMRPTGNPDSASSRLAIGSSVHPSTAQRTGNVTGVRTASQSLTALSAAQVSHPG